jgi:hypothetical protein
MISANSRTKEWINQCRGNMDPELVEKMVLAFMLVECLQKSGLEFIFKGGTSVPLATGTFHRCSIDVDIIVSPRTKIEPFLEKVIGQGVFTRFFEKLKKHETQIPAKHFHLYYLTQSGNEKHIILDVLYENNLYPEIELKKITAPILQISEEPTSVFCPSIESLLGDKLTAFAPHTTGILYGVEKELELAKQLFDISILFDHISSLNLGLNIVGKAHSTIASKELGYRQMEGITPSHILWDTFQTACSIGTHGKIGSVNEYKEIETGISKLGHGHILHKFNLEAGILCAAKIAYLAAALLTNVPEIQQIFLLEEIKAMPRITNPEYNKLEKTRLLGSDIYLYYRRAVDILGFNN